jgi:uncharacterized protein
MTRVIIDSGPLFALFAEADRWHEWSRQNVSHLREPLLTCESVVSETAFLIRTENGDPQLLLKAIGEGILEIAFDLRREVRDLAVLMKRYRDVPISLADACLIRMSEIFADSRVMTADRDFLIYRRFGRQMIPVTTPWE